MAVARNSSYSAHAPADTRELVDELRDEFQEAGIEIADPLWTIGRLDDREEAQNDVQNGNGNGNGAHASKFEDSDSEPTEG